MANNNGGPRSLADLVSRALIGSGDLSFTSGTQRVTRSDGSYTDHTYSGPNIFTPNVHDHKVSGVTQNGTSFSHTKHGVKDTGHSR